MQGRLTIDGIDVYTQYGLYVPEQGYNELIQWASLKSVAVTDWHEENGVEPDLDAPVLASRMCTLWLNGATTPAKIDALVALLSDGAYHIVHALEIERRYRLRLVSSAPPTIVNGLYVLELTFADDFPLSGYVYSAPSSSIGECDDMTIDGKLFTDYGVRILEGSRAEVTRIRDIKGNLTRDIATQNGVLYDAAVVRKREYDATIHCLMRAATLAELWNNYDALLYDLTRPQERYIGVKAEAKRYPCYYKSSSVERFYPTHKIWLEFDITINIFKDPEAI